MAPNPQQLGFWTLSDCGSLRVLFLGMSGSQILMILQSHAGIVGLSAAISQRLAYAQWTWILCKEVVQEPCEIVVMQSPISRMSMVHLLVLSLILSVTHKDSSR